MIFACFLMVGNIDNNFIRLGKNSIIYYTKNDTFFRLHSDNIDQSQVLTDRAGSPVQYVHVVSFVLWIVVICALHLIITDHLNADF